jgi:hypothetical protein
MNSKSKKQKSRKQKSKKQKSRKQKSKKIEKMYKIKNSNILVFNKKYAPEVSKAINLYNSGKAKTLKDAWKLSRAN